MQLADGSVPALDEEEARGMAEELQGEFDDFSVSGADQLSCTQSNQDDDTGDDDEDDEDDDEDEMVLDVACCSCCGLLWLATVKLI